MENRRQTGVFTTQHVKEETGEGYRLVNFSAGVKTVATTIAAVVVLVGMLAGWFNGHVQGQAVKALGLQLNTEGSDINNALKLLLDERAGEIEGHINVLRMQEQEHYEKLTSTVWRATNPDRRSDDPIPDVGGDP